MSLEYLNFDVRIVSERDGLLALIDSPAGEPEVRFNLPQELASLTQAAAQWSSDAVEKAGRALFEAVFSGELRAGYRGSYAEAVRVGKGLRLRFHLRDARDIAWIPWELLYDPERGFIAQFTDTTVVRYLDLPEAPRPPRLELPLRILAVFSSPDDPDYPRIDVDRERMALEQALGPLVKRGQVDIEPLDDARFEVLHERLQTGRFDVVHFVGHSGVDSTGEEGIVVLEASGDRGRPVSGKAFRAILADRDLRLIVLNSCESARPGGRGLFSGVAQALVQAGIPAVVAMQFPIPDPAASTMVAPFYRELALGSPVDAAVAEARKSVASQGGIAWATPVVFLRAKEGRIFAPPRPPLRQRLLQAVPHALLTVNWLLLLWAFKRVGLYFASWKQYMETSGAVLAGLAVVAYFVPVNWAELVTALLMWSNPRRRPLVVAASVLVSCCFCWAALRLCPGVDLKLVDGDVTKLAEMQIPQLDADVLSQRNLCRFGEHPGCEAAVPDGKYLRLRYSLRSSRVAEYRVRLTLEPRSSVGFAYLRVSPRFDVNGGPDRADMLDDTNDIWIASPATPRAESLAGDVDICIVGRTKPTLGRAAPTLRASFANDREGKGVMSELERCWSLRDGVRVECGPRGSEPGP